MRGRASGVLLGLVAVLVIMGLFGTRWLSNLWLSFTDKEYVVPAESSALSFTPTVMNPGSGEWWLYGEDRHNYYHFLGSADGAYRKISRDGARACKGFDPHDHTTWCT
jgi:hypothetical protein